MSTNLREFSNMYNISYKPTIINHHIFHKERSKDWKILNNHELDKRKLGQIKITKGSEKFSFEFDIRLKDFLQFDKDDIDESIKMDDEFEIVCNVHRKEKRETLFYMIDDNKEGLLDKLYTMIDEIITDIDGDTKTDYKYTYQPQFYLDFIKKRDDLVRDNKFLIDSLTPDNLTDFDFENTKDADGKNWFFSTFQIESVDSRYNASQKANAFKTNLKKNLEYVKGKIEDARTGGGLRFVAKKVDKSRSLGEKTILYYKEVDVFDYKDDDKAVDDEVKFKITGEVGGAISGLKMLNFGTGYKKDDIITLKSATSSDASVKVKQINKDGGVLEVTIENGGTGYVLNQEVTDKDYKAVEDESMIDFDIDFIPKNTDITIKSQNIIYHNIFKISDITEISNKGITQTDSYDYKTFMKDNNIDILVSMLIYEIKPRIIYPKSIQEIQINNTKRSILKGKYWNFPPANDQVFKNIVRDKYKMNKKGENLEITNTLRAVVSDYKKAIDNIDKNLLLTYPDNYIPDFKPYENEDQDIVEFFYLKIVKRGKIKFDNEEDEIIHKKIKFENGLTQVDIEIIFKQKEEHYIAIDIAFVHETDNTYDNLNQGDKLTSEKFDNEDDEIEIKLYETKYKVKSHDFKELLNKFYDYERQGENIPECDDYCVMMKALFIVTTGGLAAAYFGAFALPGGWAIAAAIVLGVFLSMYYSPRYAGEYKMHNFYYNARGDHRPGAPTFMKTKSDHEKEDKLYDRHFTNPYDDIEYGNLYMGILNCDEKNDIIEFVPIRTKIERIYEEVGGHKDNQSYTCPKLNEMMQFVDPYSIPYASDSKNGGQEYFYELVDINSKYEVSEGNYYVIKELGDSTVWNRVSGNKFNTNNPAKVGDKFKAKETLDLSGGKVDEIMLIFSFDRFKIDKSENECDYSLYREQELDKYFCIGKFVNDDGTNIDDIQSISFEIPYYPRHIKNLGLHHFIMHDIRFNDEYGRYNNWMKELKKLLTEKYAPLNRYFKYILKEYMDDNKNAYLIQIDLPKFNEFVDKEEYYVIQKQALKFIKDFNEGNIELVSIYFQYTDYCNNADNTMPNLPCDNIKTWKNMWIANDDPYFRIGASYSQGYKVSYDQMPIFDYKHLQSTHPNSGFGPVQDPLILLKHFDILSPYLRKGVSYGNSAGSVGPRPDIDGSNFVNTGKFKIGNYSYYKTGVEDGKLISNVEYNKHYVIRNVGKMSKEEWTNIGWTGKPIFSNRSISKEPIFGDEFIATKDFTLIGNAKISLIPKENIIEGTHSNMRLRRNKKYAKHLCDAEKDKLDVVMVKMNNEDKWTEFYKHSNHKQFNIHFRYFDKNKIEPKDIDRHDLPLPEDELNRTDEEFPKIYEYEVCNNCKIHYKKKVNIDESSQKQSTMCNEADPLCNESTNSYYKNYRDPGKLNAKYKKLNIFKVNRITKVDTITQYSDNFIKDNIINKRIIHKNCIKIPSSQDPIYYILENQKVLDNYIISSINPDELQIGYSPSSVTSVKKYIDEMNQGDSTEEEKRLQKTLDELKKLHIYYVDFFIYRVMEPLLLFLNSNNNEKIIHKIIKRIEDKEKELTKDLASADFKTSLRYKLQDIAIQYYPTKKLKDILKKDFYITKILNEFYIPIGQKLSEDLKDKSGNTIKDTKGNSLSITISYILTHSQLVWDYKYNYNVYELKFYDDELIQKTFDMPITTRQNFCITPRNDINHYINTTNLVHPQKYNNFVYVDPVINIQQQLSIRPKNSNMSINETKWIEDTENYWILQHPENIITDFSLDVGKIEPLKSHERVILRIPNIPTEVLKVLYKNEDLNKYAINNSYITDILNDDFVNEDTFRHIEYYQTDTNTLYIQFKTHDDLISMSEKLKQFLHGQKVGDYILSQQQYKKYNVIPNCEEFPNQEKCCDTNHLTHFWNDNTKMCEEKKCTDFPHQLKCCDANHPTHVWNTITNKCVLPSTGTGADVGTGTGSLMPIIGGAVGGLIVIIIAYFLYRRYQK